jgi:hypothetical protein
VGDLPAFGSFRLTLDIPRNLLTEAYHSQMQVVSMKQKTFVMDEEKFIILEQGHQCFIIYNTKIIINIK